MAGAREVSSRREASANVRNSKTPLPELDQRPMDDPAAGHENREKNAALIGTLVS
jgi:hypothetical protein